MYWKGKMYMNYTEFKKKYPFATKEYPDTMSLPFNSDKFIGSMRKTKQVKKGSRWITIKEETESITTQFYMNTLEAIPFFRKSTTPQPSRTPRTSRTPQTPQTFRTPQPFTSPIVASSWLPCYS